MYYSSEAISLAALEKWDLKGRAEGSSPAGKYAPFQVCTWTGGRAISTSEYTVLQASAGVTSTSSFRSASNTLGST